MTLPKTALEGIRVLDLGRYQAGPRIGLVLARLGAEVIKIEAPGGDESRQMEPHVRGQSAYWVQYNSGKKSLGLNLRSDKGKAILRELVRVSDIFIQNFRPGTIEAMGFGYEQLRALNRRLIMVNVSAYGQYGPYRDRLGFDPIGQAISGMMSLTGFPGTPPTRTYNPVIDRITALHGTIGALAALRERELSGEGQAIDVCLADTGFSMTEIQCCAYLGAGIVPERVGNGRGLMNTYQTRDGWVLIAAMSDNIWPRLCEAIGAPEWRNDPRFRRLADRHRAWQDIEARLRPWFAARTTREAVDTLAPLGIPISPVNDIPAAAQEPHLHARELLVEVPDPIAGRIHVSGKHIKLSRSETVIGPAPLPGQHTEEILTTLLHYRADEVAALEAEGVIYCSRLPAAAPR
ncbi:MAG: formyl-CoA transferase [Candidatus Tectimicrobiota bacterium]|nr:MAG: formyl-CoA transferase [Candidatus Tectomicrobia bacterium]